MTTIDRLWPGATVVCVGTGPSLTRDDLAFCRGKAPLIVINDAYQWAPWADVLYACDDKWWLWHKGAPSFQGKKYTLSTSKWAGVEPLRNVGRTGLSLDPSGLCTGHDSGYQAINLAVLFGATKILLLGYDMRGDHCFGSHRDKSRPNFPLSLGAYQTLLGPLQAAGVEVVNCNPASALKAFRFGSLAEELGPAAEKRNGLVFDLGTPRRTESDPITGQWPAQRQTPPATAPPTVAVCLQTCGRVDYTRRTLESFTAVHQNIPSRWTLLHGDDGSDAPDRAQIRSLAAQHGFETVVQHDRRRGARAMRSALIDAAAQTGASWMLLLENDWEWVRPVPWALFDHLVATRPDVYSLRLYGQYKARNQKLPCSLTNHGQPAKKAVPWWLLPGAPEAVEIGRYHWGAPPALTRLSELQVIRRLVRGRSDRGDYAEMLVSGQIDAYVARVVENCVYHIGAHRTDQTAVRTAPPLYTPRPARPARRIVYAPPERRVMARPKPALYTPAWQEGRAWTQGGSSACLHLALEQCGRPSSLLDLGCGTGHLVTQAIAAGVSAIGVDLSIEQATETIRPADLRQPLNLDRTFDMVLCWEVAEHLPPESADVLCDTIVRHLAPGGTLLFTAATPGQGGDGHVNEQPLPYWREKLIARGLRWDRMQSRILGEAWTHAARKTPWYGKNLIVCRAEPCVLLADRPLPRVAITMRTADRSPNPNYVGGTVQRLLKQGPCDLHVCATAPSLGWLERELGERRDQVIVHVPDRVLTPNENGLAQITTLDPSAYDWVLLLEDDLAFCSDFIGSVQRWLMREAKPNRHLFRFFGFRVSPPPGRVTAYDVPWDRSFAGSQAVALRMTEALDFAAWAEANMETWGGFRGNARIAFDKLLASWAQLRWPKIPSVMSQPFFVKHIGKVSSIHPKTAHMDRYFAGEAWSYRPLEAAL